MARAGGGEQALQERGTRSAAERAWIVTDRRLEAVLGIGHRD